MHKSTEEAEGQELLQLQKTQGRADEKDGAGEGEMDQGVGGLVSDSVFGPSSFSSLLVLTAFCARILSP